MLKKIIAGKYIIIKKKLQNMLVIIKQVHRLKDA